MSFLSSLRSVGFSGSRSPSGAAVEALESVLPLVPVRGCRVSVGCQRGVDALVRDFFRSSPSLLVFSVASGRFGSGRSAFARRSVACVRSVARGERGCLVALPSSSSCPAGVYPSRKFFGWDREPGELLRLPLAVAVTFCCGCLRAAYLRPGLVWSGLFLALLRWAVGGSALLAPFRLSCLCSSFSSFLPAPAGGFLTSRYMAIASSIT